MKTAQTIKQLQEALQSCRQLHSFAVEINPILGDLKTLAGKHQKRHGGTCYRKLINELRESAKKVQRAMELEVISTERVIRSIIADDDDLKRTPHSDACQGFVKGFHGRHTASAQQRLNSRWA